MSITQLNSAAAAELEDAQAAADDGHSAGTAPKKPGRTSGNRRAPDGASVVRAIVPRLLDLEQGAAYLGLSFWSFRELVASGAVPLIRIPRPKTMRQHRRRTKGQVKGDVLRRALVDTRDLDRLVDTWREAANSPGDTQ